MLKILNNNKRYLIFVSIILLIGFTFGIIYYNLLSSDIKEMINYTIINYNNTRYNSIIKDLIIMSLLLVTSFFIIGFPLSFFYLFYEGLSLGLIFNIFIVNFKLSGLLYALIYIILNKILILVLMFFFIKRVIAISRYIIGLIIYKKDDVIRNKLICNTRNSIYLIIIVLIINVLLYFITPYIFNTLLFLLK